MLDILDKKTGKVVAVLMDDGSVVRKDEISDDIEKEINKKLEEQNKEK